MCDNCDRINAELKEMFRVFFEMANERSQDDASNRDVEDAGMIYGLAAFVATSLESFLPAAKDFATWARSKRIVSEKTGNSFVSINPSMMGH